MFDDLQQVRDAWIDRLASDVCESWAREVDLRLFAPQVPEDRLLVALVLSKIAMGDIRAWPPTAIVGDLQQCGFLADAANERFVSGVVLPVIRALRSKGAPWSRWWDVEGLYSLLVELWTGHRLQQCTADAVSSELKKLWQIGEKHLSGILQNSAYPFTNMPPDLLDETQDGAAAQLFRELAELGMVGSKCYEGGSGSQPELATRADLMEIAGRLRRRLDLEQTLPLVHDLSQRKQHAIAQDLKRFDRQMSALLRSLTWYEVQLICGSSDDDLYRDRCLVAGKGISERWLLEDDSLPPAMLFGSDSDVPRWIHDEVIAGGGRTFRTNVGPQPVWVATAEAPSHAVSMQMLAASGSKYGIKLEISDEKVVVWLVLPLAPGDPGPAVELPYIYSLNFVNGAWQLLHLASVGHVRLTAIRLTDEGEPRTIGTAVLTLPPDSCAELTAVATAALRSMIGNDLQSVLWLRGTEGLERQAESAFHGNETAKGEDLRDEFVLPLEQRAHPKWGEFRKVAKELARARSRLAVAVLDGHPDKQLRAAVAAAIENRQRALEIARAATRSAGGRIRRADDIVQALASEQDAFVHLFMMNDRLSAVVGRVVEGRPRFELLPYSDIVVQRFTQAVGTWSRLPHAPVGQDWYRYFGMLVTACEGLIRPLVEELTEQGVTRVFLSPTAPLDLLPLHAVPLKNDRAIFLNDVFSDVSYMPTVHMLKAVTQSERRPATRPAVAVAPDESTLFEAELVASVHEGTSLLAGKEATPDALLQAMRRARIVHIAAHGFTHADRWASGVELYGGSRGESTLTTSRILAEADLSSADLVVLNACRTGTHESTDRVVQTLRGMESAFLACGAKAVISTLWEITNLQAMVFAALLHAHIDVGESGAAAYRAAIVYMRHGLWRSDVPKTEGSRNAEALLDDSFNGVLDDWREQLTCQADDDPFFWAAFKITGSL